MAKKNIERQVTLSAKIKGTFSKGVKALNKSLRSFQKESKDTVRSGTKVGRSFRRAATEVKKFGAVLKKISAASRSTNRILKATIVAFVGFRALRGITRMLSQTVDEMDRLNKVSTRLGLSVKFLSRFRFAAERAGIEFNQSSIGIQRMLRRLAEIQAFGKGEGLPALELLGLDIKDLQDANGQLLDTEEILFTVGDRLKRLNKEQRVLAGFKLFDSEGVALLQLLLKGEGGIRGEFALADRFGATITQRMADAATKIKDAVKIVSVAFNKLRIDFVVKFAEPITAALVGLAEFLADLTGRAGKITDRIKEAFDPRLTNEQRAQATGQLKELAAIAFNAFEDIVVKLFDLASGGVVDLAKLFAKSFALAMSTELGRVVRDELSRIPGLGIDPSAQSQIALLRRKIEDRRARIGAAKQTLGDPRLEFARESTLQFVKESLDKIREFEREIVRLESVIEAEAEEGTQAVAEAADDLMAGLKTRGKVLVDSFTGGFSDTGDAIDELTETNFPPLVRAIIAINKGWDAWQRKIQESRPVFRSFSEIMLDIRLDTEKFVKQLKAAGPAIGEAVFKLSQFGAEMRARTLSALGQTGAAALVRFDASQLAQQQQARADKLPPVALGALARTQALERQRFVFDQQRTASLAAVTEAEKRHGRVLEMNSRRLDAGLISQERAREVIEGQDAALKSVIQSTLTKMQVMAEDDRFTSLLADDIEDLTLRLQELALVSDRTFTGGFTAGIRQFRREAADAAAQGRLMADTLTSSLSGGLTDAIIGVVDGTKKMSEAFRDMARQVLRDIGTMLIRMAVLRALSAGFGVAGFNSGGLVQGFNSGGFVGGARGANRDTRTIGATVGEYVNDRDTVDYYTPEFFEGLKRRLLPRGTAQAFSRRRAAMPSSGMGFNQGGEVGPGGGAQVLPVLITDGPQLDRLTAAQKSALVRVIGENDAEFRGALKI